MRTNNRLTLTLASLCAGLLCAAGALAQPSMTTWGGVFSAAQATAGEGVYLERCAGCHLPDLSGGEDAPELAGALFGGRWNDRTLGDLLDRMQRTMPQDAPGSLTGTEYAQLLAYVLQRNGFPEGASALSDKPEALKDIRFVTQPPGR